VSGGRTARDALALALSSVVARVVLLARGIVAAAVLGPAGFGAWNALGLVLDYGAYASAGAAQGLDLRLPAAERSGAAAESRRLLAGAWALTAAAFGVFALGVAIVLARGAPVLRAGTGPGPALLMLAAAGVQLAIQQAASALKARGRFAPVSQAAALQAVLGGGLGLAWVAPLGLWGLAGGWLAGGLAALARLRIAAPDVPLAPRGLRTGAALAWAGAPVFGFFLASLVLRSVDRLALVGAGAQEALGLYSLGLMAAGSVLYLPEALAAVLYPRIAAASAGALDLAATRAEVVRAQRALTVVLPLAVAIAMVWVDPVLHAWLPRYRGGAGAMRVLAFGALLLSAATLPGYWLLGRGRAWGTLAAAAACAALTAVLVTGVAARAPRPAPVAVAACVGYAAFALLLVVASSRDLLEDDGERLGFGAASLLPAAWAGATAFAVCGIGPAAPVGGALLRSVAVGVAYAPVAWWLGRGLGLTALARGWLRTGGRGAGA
jgi:O-antigen/teichoic acid export membrane protein